MNPRADVTALFLGCLIGFAVWIVIGVLTLFLASSSIFGGTGVPLGMRLLVTAIYLALVATAVYAYRQAGKRAEAPRLRMMIVIAAVIGLGGLALCVWPVWTR